MDVCCPCCRQLSRTPHTHVGGRAEPRGSVRMDDTSSRAKQAICRWRDESGQAIVLSAVWMIVLLGMAGLVIDVGSWYRAQRNLQSDADAAALAGAQELPDDTGAAGVMAKSFAQKNGYTLPTSGITFSGVTAPNDSITVKVKAPSPTY